MAVEYLIGPLCGAAMLILMCVGIRALCRASSNDEGNGEQAAGFDDGGGP